MPQMAPISWLTMFIIFSVVFMLFSVMNYYSTTPTSPKSLTSKMKLVNPLNWKW